MPYTKESANVAMYAAYGLGIADKDITFVEDWTFEEVKELFDEITKEFTKLGAEGKRTFLFIYVAARGVLDRQ